LCFNFQPAQYRHELEREPEPAVELVHAEPVHHMNGAAAGPGNGQHVKKRVAFRDDPVDRGEPMRIPRHAGPANTAGDQDYHDDQLEQEVPRTDNPQCRGNAAKAAAPELRDPELRENAGDRRVARGGGQQRRASPSPVGTPEVRVQDTPAGRGTGRGAGERRRVNGAAGGQDAVNQPPAPAQPRQRASTSTRGRGGNVGGGPGRRTGP